RKKTISDSVDSLRKSGRAVVRCFSAFHRGTTREERDREEPPRDRLWVKERVVSSSKSTERYRSLLKVHN
ncbi:hypothetical protein PENTCL1PPCAC_23711, partial [Pristionchus entomophagus]